MYADIIYRKIKLDDELEIILRAPRWGDIDDLYELHKQLVEEDAMIGADSIVNQGQMMDRHVQLIKACESGRTIAIIAEVNGQAVGQCNARKRGGRLKHTAGLGVFLLWRSEREGQCLCASAFPSADPPPPAARSVSAAAFLE